MAQRGATELFRPPPRENHIARGGSRFEIVGSRLFRTLRGDSGGIAIQGGMALILSATTCRRKWAGGIRLLGLGLLGTLGFEGLGDGASRVVELTVGTLAGWFALRNESDSLGSSGSYHSPIYRTDPPGHNGGSETLSEARNFFLKARALRGIDFASLIVE